MDPKHLEHIELFAQLTADQRKEIARQSDEIDVEAGSRIITEGRFGYEFFVLKDGSAEVVRGGEHLADLGPGDFFGEIAIMEHDRRTASVVATTPVTAIVMLARDFETMAGVMPHVAEKIHEAIRARMQR